MSSYLIRRCLQALGVLFVVSVVVFTLLHLLPGGPARALLGPRATHAAISAFNAQYGLDKPLPIQYLLWVSQVLQGRLGYSYKLDQSVAGLIADDLPRTGLLVGIAVVLALCCGACVGLWQALRRGRPDDHFLTALAFVFYAMPTFFLGLILILVFSVWLGWLPPLGPTGSVPVYDQLANLVLPVLTLTLVYAAYFSRYMRSSVLEAVVQDYIRTARAKGLAQGMIVLRHVVRNALMPLITLTGLSLPAVISGALVTEALFNYPGMGLLFWNAAQEQDYPVLLGVTLLTGAATVVGSLLADVAYAVVDPRIRYVG